MMVPRAGIARLVPFEVRRAVDRGAVDRGASVTSRRPFHSRQRCGINYSDRERLGID